MEVTDANTLEAAQHPAWALAQRAGAALGVAVLGGILGAGLSLDRPTEFDVGPHAATIQLAKGGMTTADFGLLGAANNPLHTQFLGQKFGADIHVDGINPALESENNTLTSTVWQQYGALILNKDTVSQQSTEIKSAFEQHAVDDARNGAMLGGGLTIGGMAAGWAFKRGIKKRLVPRLAAEQQAGAEALLNYKPGWRTAVVAGAATVALTGVGLAAEYHALPRNPSTVTNADPALANTPFAGTELHGLIQPAVDAALPAVEKYLAQSTTFYDTAARNLTTAFDLQADKSLKDVPQGPEYESFLFETDQHCNSGMSEVEAAAMQESGASLLIAGGDNDFSGTLSFENICTADLAKRLSAMHTSLVGVRGNHDSAQLTLPDMTAQGWTMLEDDKPHTIDGITMMGAGDTRRSTLGSAITGTLADEYTIGHDLSQAACDSQKPVGIIVVHEPQAGYEAAMNACASLVLTGHTHQEYGPVSVATDSGKTPSYFYTGGTAGGAVDNGLEKGDLTMVGPLHADAVFAIFVWDKTTDRPAGHYTITIHPDATANIGPYTAIGSSPATTFTLPSGTP